MRKKTIYRFTLTTLAASTLLIGIWHSASSFSGKIAEDLWKQLGITQLHGNENIRSSFASGYSNIYGIRNAKNIAVGNRAAVAKNLLTYTKNYVSSNEFKNYYSKERASHKPVEPVKEPKTKEQIRLEQIAQTEENIKKAEQSLIKLGPEYKKSIQPSIDKAKEQVEEYKKPDNKVIGIMYQGELAKHKSDWERYNADLKKWQLRYPEDPKVLIKDRLMQYLTLAATVDFDAELAVKNNKKRFINPAYESKSNDWKMIYRAGKDVYEVTKAFAEEWLKAL